MLKIVIADDNELLRVAMIQVLEVNGYHVVQSRDGNECLKVVRDWKPDVVITDLLMPGMEGMELIRELRRGFPQIPIIAMSGLRDAVTLKCARLLGAAHVLSKPFEEAELLATVADITRVSRSWAQM